MAWARRPRHLRPCDGSPQRVGKTEPVALAHGVRRDRGTERRIASPSGRQWRTSSPPSWFETAIRDNTAARASAARRARAASASSCGDFAERMLKPTMPPDRANRFLTRWLISLISKCCRSRAFLSSVMSRRFSTRQQSSRVSCGSVRWSAKYRRGFHPCAAGWSRNVRSARRGESSRGSPALRRGGRAG
jgi:hypothetical protein